MPFDTKICRIEKYNGTQTTEGFFGMIVEGKFDPRAEVYTDVVDIGTPGQGLSSGIGLRAGHCLSEVRGSPSSDSSWRTRAFDSGRTIDRGTIGPDVRQMGSGSPN